MNGVKAVLSACLAYIAGVFNMLGPMIILLILSMIVDYITGLIKAGYQKRMCYKCGIWGIVKKTLTMLVVAVGIGLDWLIAFLSKDLEINLPIKMFFGGLVTVWLIINEWISMLSNITVVVGQENMPKFLLPIIKKMQKAIEEEAESEKNK